MNVKEVQEELGVSRATIYRMINNDILHPVQIGPKVTRFNRNEILTIANGGGKGLKVVES